MCLNYTHKHIHINKHTYMHTHRYIYTYTYIYATIKEKGIINLIGNNVDKSTGSFVGKEARGNTIILL